MTRYKITTRVAMALELGLVTERGGLISRRMFPMRSFEHSIDRLTEELAAFDPLIDTIEVDEKPFAGAAAALAYLMEQRVPFAAAS